MFKPTLLFSSASRDVLTLASGRMGAFTVTFLATPILTRIFSPADFGVAALFIVIVTLTAQLLPLAYQNAIVVPKNEGDAESLVRITIYSSVVLSCFLFLLLVIKNIIELSLPLTEQLGFWEWFVPIVALMMALSSICECWLTRKKGFIASSKATFAQAAVTSGGRLSLGIVWGASIWGLMIPYIAGVLLRLGMLIRASLSSRTRNIERSSIGEVSREFYEFPKYNLFAGFLRVLSDNLPVLILAPFFGVAAAGLYAMADRLIKIPLTMGAMTVRRVYLQRASAIKHRGGDLKDSYLKTTGYLVVLGVVPLILLMLAGQPMLKLFLGDRWAQAGVYVEILAPLLYLMLISQPATALVDLLRQQRLWLRLQMGISLLRVLVMLLAWYWLATVESVLWGFVIGGAIPYFWLILYVYNLLNRLKEND